MPAIASFTLHTAGAGVVMDDVGLRGDEDFLLVHSVEDSAEYREEITHFDITGDMIYNCLKDPRLVVAYDADCLAFKGLANMHPGKAVNPAVLNNYLSDAFSNGGSIWSGGTIRYRRPRRKRNGAALASIQFELEVIPADLSSATPILTTPAVSGTAGSPVYSVTWPNPANVLSSSTATTPPAQAEIFGCTIWWKRTTTLDLGTLDHPAGVGYVAELTHYYQGLPADSPQPANYTQFLSMVDSHGNGDSEIVEVYHVPTATTWFPVSGVHGTIPTLLLVPSDPRVLNQPNTVTNEWLTRYIAKWEDPTSGDFYADTAYVEDYADLAAFQADFPDDAYRTLISVFDAKTNAYLA